MAVLAKPNGLLATAYIAATNPLQYLDCVPGAHTQIERRWQAEQLESPHKAGFRSTVVRRRSLPWVQAKRIRSACGRGASRYPSSSRRGPSTNASPVSSDHHVGGGARP